MATIGRTWFVHSDDAASNDEVEECLLESQTAYLKSLAVCDKLRETVSEKELLEMRSRLYLNLGLTYENQKDSSRAKSFMEKALIIARYIFTFFIYSDPSHSIFFFTKIEITLFSTFLLDTPL